MNNGSRSDAMDAQRQKFEDDIKRLQDALHRTRSPFLKRDYAKAIKRKRRLLRAYDGYRKGAAL